MKYLKNAHVSKSLVGNVLQFEVFFFSNRVTVFGLKIQVSIAIVLNHCFGNHNLEVCIPELVWNETRRDWQSLPELAGLWQDYLFLVPLLGKIREKNGTGLDYSVSLGKVLSSTESWDFSRISSINNTTQNFSWLALLIIHMSVPIRYCYQNCLYKITDLKQDGK